MINIYTKGKNFHKEILLPLDYHENIFKQNKSLKIVFIDKTPVNILHNNRIIKITSPTLLLMNGALTNIEDIEGSFRILNFYPTVINNKLSDENIKNKETLQGSDFLDLYYLASFTEVQDYDIIELNPYYRDKINYFFDKIKLQLQAQEDKFWPCRSRALFLELLIILSNLKNEILYEDTDNLVENIKIYLNNNLEQHITLDILTKEFSVNKTTLTKKFKEETGKTILEFLIELRLSLAKSFLKNTSLPIIEILYKVGFNNSANFNKAFKKNFGNTPINYRKLQKVQ